MKKVKVAGGGKGGAPTAPTDLLVCFPARQHLALMPKSICSPSRATLDRAVAARRRQLQLPAARSGPSGAGGGVAGGRGRGSSPMFHGSKAKHTAEGDNEPQSPKVTCAGQIKVVRPRKPRPVVAEKNGRCGGGGSGGRWITVAEEIERLQEQRKKASWLDAFGIRRDALPFLGGALRSLRHKVRCFGPSLHAAVDSSTDDDDDEGGDAGGHVRESATAASVFSKWLMVLEGSQEPQPHDNDELHQEDARPNTNRETNDDDCSKASSVPPPNALLLMRCRSAPAKGLARKGAEEPPAGEETAPEKGGPEDGMDELVFMRTAPDFLKLSIDIAKETWVVGGVDPLARSRSWKR
ncbi:uncharacterized protein LOC124652180 [Lolium rigidum]|uniref:uncharacterized protein LOC124652180 n=1 Tax=Lolium rigidum TaxID=89674 RepID=UPI001F5D1909|nr:uncharacterized protein LOC124652180 [Lolium rigidum]